MDEISVEHAKKEIRKIGYTLWIKRIATFAVVWSSVLYISYLLVGTHLPIGGHIMVLLFVSVPLFFISLTNAYSHWMWADASKIWTNPLKKLANLRGEYEKIALGYPSYTTEGRGQMVNGRHYFKEYIHERNKAVRDASLRNNESPATQEDGSSGALSVRSLTSKELFIALTLAVRDASLRNNKSSAKQEYGSSGALSVRPLTSKELFIVWTLLFVIGVITCVVATLTGPAT